MYKIDYKAMGKRIRKRRLEKGFTQAELAEMVEVGESHIGGIERGENICSLDVLASIAEVLELNLDVLVKGINEQNASQAFSEILGEVPEGNKGLYVKMCESLTGTWK